MTYNVKCARILDEVETERYAQDEKWGQQNHPDGTGGAYFAGEAVVYRNVCDHAHKVGQGTWRHILREEVYEAFAESDPAKLRTELIQVAAVAAAWVEAIDRRQ